MTGMINAGLYMCTAKQTSCWFLLLCTIATLVQVSSRLLQHNRRERPRNTFLKAHCGSVRPTSKRRLATVIFGCCNWVFLMAAMEEALTNAGILQIIFSYEGPGSWLFIPPVCQLWKQCYEKVDPAPLQRSYPEAHVTIRLTAYGAAFRSLSRFHMACEHGLQAYFATQLAQERAGAWCDVPTLLAAQKLGLKVTDSFITGAATQALAY
jgi:hypothetical protein